MNAKTDIDKRRNAAILGARSGGARGAGDCRSNAPGKATLPENERRRDGHRRKTVCGIDAPLLAATLVTGALLAALLLLAGAA